MSEQRKLVAVKLGTDCVDSEDRINDHARRLAVVHETHDLVVIASGAVARGDQRLEAMRQPAHDVDRRDRAFLGTAGSTGQWETGFERQGVMAGQVLMTYYEMVDAREGPRFKNAMARVIGHRYVPVCNYKDFLSVASDPHDEIEKIDIFKDNDRFAREVAEILGAQALILATNGVDGFEDKFGNVVHEFQVSRLDNMRAEDYKPSDRGTGDIVSKLTEAAAAVTGENPMQAFVCNADADFDQILAGQRICTEVVQ